MKKKPYEQVFDNYLPKPRDISKSKLSYEDFLKLHAPALNNLLLHLQNAPLQYKSFIEFIYKDILRLDMYYTAPNHLIGIKNIPALFSGPNDFLVALHHNDQMFLSSVLILTMHTFKNCMTYSILVLI